MAYKLSERLQQDFPKEHPVSSDIDLNRIKNVFLFFGILSLFTAWVFSFDSGTIFNNSVRPTFIAENAADTSSETNEKYVAVVGPLVVNKFQEVYSVFIYSNLPVNSWSFIEGEVLDAEKDYLFSFGRELWHESGYDEGNWEEAENSYTMKITFPQPGKYYLNFKTQGNSNPGAINVVIQKHIGSSIPHMVFGIICLLIGIVLNEIRNRTIARVVTIIAKRASEKD